MARKPRSSIRCAMKYTFMAKDYQICCKKAPKSMARTKTFPASISISIIYARKKEVGVHNLRDKLTNIMSVLDK